MTEPRTLAYELAGGATLPDYIAHGVTVLQPPDGLASCAFTWWTPPGPPALDDDTCRQLIDLRAAGIHRTDVEREPWRAEAWTLPTDLLGDDLADRVTEAADTANRFWWRLDITEWHIELKRYEVGNQHGQHVDLHPSSMTRKVQSSTLLSDPGDYRGGQLEALFCGQSFTGPRHRGSVVVFPAWIPHSVTPIEAGERWSLIVTGVGPAIR